MLTAIAEVSEETSVESYAEPSIDVANDDLATDQYEIAVSYEFEESEVVPTGRFVPDPSEDGSLFDGEQVEFTSVDEVININVDMSVDDLFSSEIYFLYPGMTERFVSVDDSTGDNGVDRDTEVTVVEPKIVTFLPACEFPLKSDAQDEALLGSDSNDVIAVNKETDSEVDPMIFTCFLPTGQFPLNLDALYETPTGSDLTDAVAVDEVPVHVSSEYNQQDTNLIPFEESDGEVLAAISDAVVSAAPTVAAPTYSGGLPFRSMISSADRSIPFALLPESLSPVDSTYDQKNPSSDDSKSRAQNQFDSAELVERDSASTSLLTIEDSIEVVSLGMLHMSL